MLGNLRRQLVGNAFHAKHRKRYEGHSIMAFLYLSKKNRTDFKTDYTTLGRLHVLASAVFLHPILFHKINLLKSSFFKTSRSRPYTYSLCLQTGIQDSHLTLNEAAMPGPAR
jgi:hypothetical protein